MIQGSSRSSNGGRSDIPTLTRDLSVFQYTSAPDYLTDPFFLRGESLFRPQIERVKIPLHAKTQASPGAQDARRWLDQALEISSCCQTAVRIAMGTDSGTSLGRWQGYFEHVEMELMVKAGSDGDADAQRRDGRCRQNDGD